MRLLKRAFARLSALVTRRQQEERLRAEFEAHIALSTEDNLRAGLSPVEARRQALLKFGSVEAIKEEYRDARGLPWLESLWRDVRFALRMMRRAPGFTAVAVLSLALGIGANTAIFSLVNTLMLRSLPVREPGQLVEMLHQYPGQSRGNIFSEQVYKLMRDNSKTLTELIASSAPWHSVFRLSVDGFGEQRVNGEYVSGNFFSALGLRPAIGRLIGPEDDNAGGTSAAAVVVSWSFWKSRFGLDPGILGKRITVEDAPVTIIGVTPREFHGLEAGTNPDVWLPLAIEPVTSRRTWTGTSVFWLRLTGRLAPGVSIEQAHAELEGLYQRTLEEMARVRDDPNALNWKFELEPAGAGLSPLRDQYGRPLLLLMAVAGLLLLLTCTNLASMLLAQGAARQREMATRASLGAGRFRLMRQVLTEALLLSGAGSLFGMLLAFLGTGVLVRIVESGRGRLDLPVEPDASVLLFAAGTALLTGLLFGLVPALRAMVATPASSLRATGKAAETGLGRLFGRGLVAAQVAISLVLLSAAALFVGHLRDLRGLDLGFARDEVLLVNLEPERSRMDAGRLSSAYRTLLERLEAIPGVRLASTAAVSPLSGTGGSRLATVEGYQDSPGEYRFLAFNSVAPGYFETLGMPLLAGRDFRFQEPDGLRGAIVNETMARYYFGDDDPIGKRFTFDGDAKPQTIVGVVGDAEYSDWREEIPRTVYFNSFASGMTLGARHLVIRTSVEPLTVAPEVRRVVREVMASVPIKHITTLRGQFEETLVPERLTAQLAGLFAALGAVLAAIGLFGLLAYTVARRTNEIGLRMALGATPGDATRIVLRDALGMVCAGLAIGALAAFWSKRLAATVFEGLALENPLLILFAGAVIIAVALVAGYLPARRAANVDPMVALRHE